MEKFGRRYTEITESTLSTVVVVIIPVLTLFYPLFQGDFGSTPTLDEILGVLPQPRKKRNCIECITNKISDDFGPLKYSYIPLFVCFIAILLIKGNVNQIF